MFSYIVVLAIVVCAIGSSSSRHHKLKENSVRRSFQEKADGLIAKYPFQVAVFKKHNGKTLLCGGTILNSDSILTAASCIRDSDVDIKVRSGSTTFREGGVLTMVRSITRNPLFNSATDDNNIAVLKLEKHLKMNNHTKPVVLAESGQSLPEGAPVTVIGWGTTSREGFISPLLSDYRMNVVSRENCLKSYANSEVTDTATCAGTDECKGDYGGPLLDANGVQFGVASYGKGCLEDDELAPAIYTNVGDFRKFISQVADK